MIAFIQWWSVFIPFYFTPTTTSISILIDKSDHVLVLYQNQQAIKKYKVVFGSDDLADKMMEGDRKTPEGQFKIINKRIHPKWHRFLHIDYPNEASREKFNERKKQGIIPINAKIGGSIGIHGTWPNEDFAIDNTQNWTLGCISMKNKDVEELYQLVPVGTTVIIQQ